MGVIVERLTAFAGWTISYGLRRGNEKRIDPLTSCNIYLVFNIGRRTIRQTSIL